MKRSIFTMVAAALFVPALARADGDAPRRPTQVHVHVASTKPVTVQQHLGGDWIDMCDAPCDRALPADGEYRVGGDGVRSSKTFTLERDTRHVDLSVHAGSTVQRSGGIALGVLGGLGTLVGVTMVVIGSFQFAAPTLTASQAPVVGVSFAPGETAVGPNRDLMAAGGVAIGFGVVAAIAGIALAATATTTVEQHAQPLTNALANADVAPRAPTWREPAAGPAEIGRPMLLPLCSGRF